MGKIRVRTLGDEKKEKEDKKAALKKAEAKKLSEKEVKEPVKAEQEAPVKEVVEKTETAEKTTEKAKVKASKFKSTNKKARSDKYLAAAQIVDKNKKYALKEALSILPKIKIAKFDETVELHINTLEKNVSGNVTLPHGTGKEIKIEIVNQSEDQKHVEEVIKKVEGGNIYFDVLIATPDSMPKLARIAKFLGPRGLMPNPKNGTVTPKPAEIAKKFQGGQVNFKTEAKFPILHMVVGKVSFGDKKLEENIKAAIAAVQMKNVKNITLKSTMSPGIKIEAAGLV